MEESGTGITQLTNTPGSDNLQPCWSPDGKRIVFCSDRRGFGYEIWVMNADGSNQTCLAPRQNWGWDSRPAWSPDGKRIAFSSARTGARTIWIMDTNGQNQVAITSPAGYVVGDLHPAWTPNGQRIAFTSDRHNGPYQIYVVNANGTGLKQVTSKPSDTEYPAWNHDGTLMTFSSRRPAPGGPGGWTHELFVMDGSGTVTQLTQNTVEYDHAATWSPDGARIAWGRAKGAFVIHVAKADGSNRQSLPSGAHAMWPDWIQGEPVWWRDFFNLVVQGLARVFRRR